MARRRLLGGNAPRRGRLVALLWVCFLAGPLASALNLPGQQADVATALIIGFAALYLALFLSISPTSHRRDLFLLAGLLVVALVLPPAYGQTCGSRSCSPAAPR